jgi:hypothetical protein
MIKPGTRVHVKEAENDHADPPMPGEFEGTFKFEQKGEDGTWISLEDCSPGAPQRLVRKELCESMEPVEGD